jgi:hypothetical protein
LQALFQSVQHICEKGKEPDPDTDPGGPKTCESGSTTMRSTGTSGGGGGRGLGALGARLNGWGMVLGFRSMGAPYLNLGRVSPTPWACNANILVNSDRFE